MANYDFLKKILIGVIALLFVQYLMGMGLNLFVSIPTEEPLAFFSYADGAEALAHIINGLLILSLSSFIIGYSVLKVKSNTILGLSILGVTFTLISLITGFLFFLQGQNDSFSAGMALGFISVFTTFFSEIYALRRLEYRVLGSGV